MIRSMTGFGEARVNDGGVNYAVEVRSVNNRYFKCSVKIPDTAQHAEPKIEKILRKRVARGSVSLILRVRNESESAAYLINHRALSGYIRELQKAELPAGTSATIDLAMLATLPGVCQPPDAADEERDRQAVVITQLVEEALDDMTTMRTREGQALRDDLLANCELMRRQIDIVDDRLPAVVEEYQQRLGDRVQQLINKARLELDRETLCREVALFADRSDVSEEIVRLRTHIDHFVEMCDSPEIVGRKLDFLAQELLREANTVGSKSNDAVIARSVVNMKSLIDRIKEQVQNVE
jgi:uncharacterized protein (TIGR00255 family)